MLNFPGLWKGIFIVCPWMVRKSPILPLWSQTSSLTLELSQKTKKNYVFEKIFKHSLNFEPLPRFISRLNSKFDYTTLCVLNWSLVSENLVLKSYLYQNLSRKAFGGAARPPPPLRSGRVNLLSSCIKVTTHFLWKLDGLKTLCPGPIE